MPAWLGIVVTFHFVTFTWIYFRAPNLTTAHEVLAGALTGPLVGWQAFLSEHAYVLALLLIFFATHQFDSHARLRLALRRSPKPVVWAIVLMVATLAVALSQGSSAKFIYFDF